MALDTCEVATDSINAVESIIYSDDEGNTPGVARVELNGVATKCTSGDGT